MKKKKKNAPPVLEEETAVALPAELPEAAPAPTGEKLSIYDYEQKYVRHENVRGARLAIGFFASVVGVFLFAVLAMLALRVFELNVYAGYAVSAVCLLAFVLVFVVPLVKILRTGYFITNVNAMTARKAKRHNQKLRHDIAEKIIDLTARVEGVGWYDSKVVGELAIALKTGDEPGVTRALGDLFRGSVKKSAKSLIFKSSMKSAAYSALSPTAHVDAALVAIVNLQLVKDIVFLYGFRPSDAKLVRIFAQVIKNSLVAYGVGNIRLGGTVVKTMGDAMKGIPLLGTAISALIDSSAQGLTNAALTTVIGYQTIRYLNHEYKLQEILDGVDLGTEAEIEEACAELETELRKKKKQRLAEVG